VKTHELCDRTGHNGLNFPSDRVIDDRIGDIISALVYVTF
jgi:hypothetical protein